MKEKVILLSATLYFYAFSLIASQELPKDNLFKTKEAPTYFKEKLLYGTIAAGGALSLLIWAPQTLDMINQRGFVVATLSTHIPRVVLDGLTITAGVYGLYEIYKKESSDDGNSEN